MQPPSDAELMSRVREGDPEAFAEVVNRYKDPMVNYLCRLSGSRARAEDLAQETFLRLYQRRSAYEEQGKLGGYLYRIATNLLRSEQRRDVRRRLLRIALLAGGNGDGPSPGPQALALSDEARRKLAAAVGRLPLRYRVPLVLFEIQGLSYAEIAGVTGCREGTIKSRINRGRGILKKKLAPYFGGGAP